VVQELLDEGTLTGGFVVYRGPDRLRSRDVDVLPVEEFFHLLHTDGFPGDPPGA